jgi:acyl-CoA thioesterase
MNAPHDKTPRPDAIAAANAGLTPQQVADKVRDGMWANDRATRHLGMQIAAIGPGTATLTMVVREEMLNGHDTCHGGFIATLADSAFAFACNAGNEMTFASGFAIDFIAPARQGDTLTATCSEVSRAGRTGVYDVDVRNQSGERIAAFRGRSYAIKGRPVVGG